MTKIGHYDGTTMAAIHNWCEIDCEWHTDHVRIPDDVTCEQPDGTFDADALSRWLDENVFGYDVSDDDYEESRWKVEDWSVMSDGQIITLECRSDHNHLSIVIVDLT